MGCFGVGVEEDSGINYFVSGYLVFGYRLFFELGWVVLGFLGMVLVVVFIKILWL